MTSQVAPRRRRTHLHAEAVGRVEHQLGLVLPIDSLVPEKTSSRDHGRRHAVADKENRVLGETLLGKRQDRPSGDGLRAAIVLEDGLPLAGLVERNVAVRLGLDVHKSRCLCVLGKEVLGSECKPSDSWIFTFSIRADVVASLVVEAKMMAGV